MVQEEEEDDGEVLPDDEEELKDEPNGENELKGIEDIEPNGDEDGGDEGDESICSAPISLRSIPAILANSASDWPRVTFGNVTPKTKYIKVHSCFILFVSLLTVVTQLVDVRVCCDEWRNMK